MKITVRCGVLDRGKPHGRELGSIQREDLDFAAGRVTFDRLRLEEWRYDCPKHGALQIHDGDLLRLALKPSPPVMMATSVERLYQP